MDLRDDRIKEDVKDILHTREAIADKLEMLERRVEERMERSRMAVKELVDHTADVVEDVMDKTKRTFDPIHQFRERPWLILGGAVALGYLVGMIENRMRSSGVYPYYTPDTAGADVMPDGSRTEDAEMRHEGIYPFYPGNGEREPGRRETRAASRIPFVQDIVSELTKELDTVKEGIIQAGREFIRDISTQVVPALFRSFSERALSGIRHPEREGASRNSFR
jgi:ElaB/YqjD/DUF883 family membrane-anchored ribosome-binding protein